MSSLCKFNVLDLTLLFPNMHPKQFAENDTSNGNTQVYNITANEKDLTFFPRSIREFYITKLL